MVKSVIPLIILLLTVSGCVIQTKSKYSDLPDGFVYIQEVIPDIVVDLRYSGDNNFVGEKIDGYLEPECIITARAAYALKNVQDELKKFGLSLKIFDAYRPTSAVDHFVKWSKNTDDRKTKNKYYPKVDKSDLIEQEYIAVESSHSRGSAVDLTIVSYKNHREIDMGTSFDFFDKKSSIYNKSVTPAQRSNRMLLHFLMTKNGFVAYEKEWWHFRLKNEPFPKTYFNFPVE